MGTDKLPVERVARSTLRRKLLCSAHTILGVSSEQLADQLSALSDLELGADQVLDMEAGGCPIPLSVEVATAELLVPGIAALEQLIEELRQVRRDPHWPYPATQEMMG